MSAVTKINEPDRTYKSSTQTGIHRLDGKLRGELTPESQICFIFDTTGSMSAYFEAVKQQLGKFVTELLLDLPKLHIGLMAHGDYGDETSSYIINSINFSNDVEHLLEWISKVGPSGGGDFPECYELALYEARTTLSWSKDPNVTKAIVIIGDAPPHSATEHEKIDYKEEVALLSESNVRIYSIRCGGSHERFWEQIANLSNGTLIEFNDTGMMTELFTELCYREVQYRANQVSPHEESSVSLKSSTDRKKALLNTVCACLLGEPTFYSEVSSQIQTKIEKLVDSLVLQDNSAEFVLQLAAYVRNILYIRSTANYLLSLAISHKECKEFVKKYFNLIVKLPSDLAEVMKFVMRKRKGVPTYLRKCVQRKFLEFDAYTLAKHDKGGKGKQSEKAKKKKKEKNIEKGKKRAAAEGRTPFDKEEREKKKREAEVGKNGEQLVEIPKVKPVVRDNKTLSLKQIVRVCHITEPVDIVMSIVGKKYPKTQEEFAKSGLKGEFSAEKAGHRMKLNVPITWETQLAARGNNATVWEDLVQDKKLPFMAMLRNLRNLLLTGVKDETHRTVLDRLKNVKQVENSKQFPFRFLQAFQSVKFSEEEIARVNNPDAPKEAVPGRRGAVAKPEKRKANPPANPITNEMVKEYEVALNRALKIATEKNVDQIDGNVLVICDVSGSMKYNPSKTIKGVYSSAKSSADIGLLMASMIAAVSKSCEIVLFSSPSGSDSGYKNVEAKESILSTFEHLVAQSQLMGKETKFPYGVLDSAIEKKKHFDYIFVMSDMIIAPHKIHPAGSKISLKIQEYRDEVNPQAKFVCVDLFGHGSASAGLNEDLEGNVHPNDLLITGYSDQILSYIGKRNEPDAQLKHVEGIYEELTKNGKEEPSGKEEMKD